jgi:hypothetical protein
MTVFSDQQNSQDSRWVMEGAGWLTVACSSLMTQT